MDNGVKLAFLPRVRGFWAVHIRRITDAVVQLATKVPPGPLHW